jgi:hypothetical protein
VYLRLVTFVCSCGYSDFATPKMAHGFYLGVCGVKSWWLRVGVKALAGPERLSRVLSKLNTELELDSW